MLQKWSLSKLNKVLIGLVFLIIFIQLFLAYNKGCPPDSMGCFGRGQISLFGFGFSDIIVLIAFGFVVSLIGTAISSLIYYFIKKDKNFTRTINFEISTFCIIFLIFQILGYIFLVSVLVY